MRKYVTLRIYNCADCPHVKVGNLYSLDGFDRGCDWFCGKTDPSKRLAAFVERESEEPKKIPEWCPLRNQGKAKGL